jgi:anion-transporting  ArsA/GET3 family ATPase
MKLFENTKVIICVGTGGVGKTTVAASLGLAAAKNGLRVLVLTIDPSKRLAQALGLTTQMSGDIRVPNQNHQLYAGLIDPQSSFQDFILMNTPDKERAQKILNNTLYKQLSTNLSGSQEFTSLERLYRACSDNRYDLIILDTPPAQNAMDFFAAPEKIYSLFQKSITKWFVTSSEESNLFIKLLNKGTLTVLGALEKLTGAIFIKELSQFFASVQEVQEIICQRSLEVQELLQGSTTKFVLVSSFDDIKLKEAKSILKRLQAMGFQLKYLIVNRYFKNWTCVENELKELSVKLNNVYEYNNQVLESIKSESQTLESQMILIDNFEEDLSGLEGLSKVANEIQNAI